MCFGCYWTRDCKLPVEGQRRQLLADWVVIYDQETFTRLTPASALDRRSFPRALGVEQPLPCTSWGKTALDTGACELDTQTARNIRREAVQLAFERPCPSTRASEAAGSVAQRSTTPASEYQRFTRYA